MDTIENGTASGEGESASPGGGADATSGQTADAVSGVGAASSRTTSPGDVLGSSENSRWAVAVRGLSKSYGKRRALDRVSLEVGWGSVCGLVGPNGSGKSTIIGSIVGLLRIDSGRALVDGAEYHWLRQPGRLVGTMRQSPAFTLRNTINQHLEVMRRALGVTSQRVDDCLKEVGLEDRRRSRIGSLSGGLRQRLSLAGAILGDPRILILDEPANGMDPESAALLRRLIRGLAGRGGAVLVSTHQLAELSLWADSCYVINQGRVKSRLDSATVQDPEALFDAFLQATSGQGA